MTQTTVRLPKYALFLGLLTLCLFIAALNPIVPVDSKQHELAVALLLGSGFALLAQFIPKHVVLVTAIAGMGLPLWGIHSVQAGVDGPPTVYLLYIALSVAGAVLGAWRFKD